MQEVHLNGRNRHMRWKIIRKRLDAARRLVLRDPQRSMDGFKTFTLAMARQNYIHHAQGFG
jgi:hypothetical protein